MPARTQPAVPSGRNVRLSPLRSSKVYISFFNYVSNFTDRTFE
ncbi:Uncharacterised protein [Salmonella sp. NCTC 11881]|nr:Uncharacterised protein [Salmonella sp. NCTC 11881]